MTSKIPEEKGSPQDLPFINSPEKDVKPIQHIENVQTAFQWLDRDLSIPDRIRERLWVDLKSIENHSITESEEVKLLLNQSKKLSDTRITWEERHQLANSLRDQLHCFQNSFFRDVFTILLRIDDTLREIDFEKWMLSGQDLLMLDNKTIAEKVKMHNVHCGPKEQKAEQIIFETCFCCVRYTKEGKLMFEEKTPNQIDGQSLSKEQIKTITSQVKLFIEGFNYHSLGLLLDFLSFIRKSQTRSWKETFALYSLSPNEILKKYGGGTSGIVALALHENISKTGVKINLIGESGAANNAIHFPTPFRESIRTFKIWLEAKKNLQGYSHFMCTLPYKDSENQDKVLVFKQHFAPAVETIKQFNSLKEFETHFKSFNKLPPESIDFEKGKDLIKSILQINFNYHVIDKHTNEVCRVDLLNGTLSISPLKNSFIPQNISGQALFSLIDLLKNPEERIDISINGKIQRLKKNEALNLYLDSIQKYFKLPNDFKENIIYLFKNLETFISEIMLFPAKTIFELWNLYKEVDLSRLQAKFVVSKTFPEHSKKHLVEFEEAEKHYEKAVETMHQGLTEEARSSLLEVKKSYEAVMNTCAELQRVPLSCILDDFAVL